MNDIAAPPAAVGDNRPRFYVMVGIPGSGKSTYARRFLGGAYRISLDDIRKMITGRDYEESAEPAVVVAGHAVRVALSRWAAQKGRDLVFDATDVTRQRRAPLVATALRFGFKPIAVYVSCPLDVALKRNAERARKVPDDVIHRFYRDLVPPASDEGFEEIVHVDAAPGPG